MNQSAKLRVLVVDDHVDAAETMGMLLDALGVAHRLAFDGEQAMSNVRRFAPHAVFCDLGMPAMDGYEVARRLRGLPGGEALVLVALTGWAHAEHLAYAAGFDHHLRKPADLTQLTALLRSIRPDAV